MQESDNNGLSDLPQEVRDKVTSFGIADDFRNEVGSLKLPQFFVKIPRSLFTDDTSEYLTKENLLTDFSLNGQPYKINFETADDEIASVDINASGNGTPKVSMMDSAAQKYFREQFSQKSSDERIRVCKDMIHRQLNKMDSIDSNELKQYIDRVVSIMDRKTLDALEKSPHAFAAKIKAYIERLQAEYAQQVFSDWVEYGNIIVKDSYRFPQRIVLPSGTDRYNKSLYTTEADDMNKYEADMVLKLTGMPNIKWWHRNVEKKGFCLNGYKNHYPDFIVMTTSGKILLLETKGDQLENTETKQKLLMGRKWQDAAGNSYRYYMIFQTKEIHEEGAYSFDQFMKMLPNL